MEATIDEFSSDGFVVPQPGRGTLVVTGTERNAWLQGLLTCDVRGLGVGQAVWGLLLTRHGKIMSEVIVAADQAALLLGVSAGTGEEVRQALEDRLVTEDAAIVDASLNIGWVDLHGPGSVRLASDAARVHGCVSAELDRTGCGGAVIAIQRAWLDQLVKWLVLDSGSGSVRLASPADWEQLRVESGLPEFGVDYGPNDNPQEASIEQRAVCWTKGCYLGQEVVMMQQARGRVKRRVVPLVFDDDRPVTRGAQLVTPVGGVTVGKVTSAGRLGSGGAIALARIKSEHAMPGTRLVVDDRAATVVERPALLQQST